MINVLTGPPTAVLRTVLAVALMALALQANPAHATPVKCAETDSTTDGRVFPEAQRQPDLPALRRVQVRDRAARQAASRPARDHDDRQVRRAATTLYDVLHDQRDGDRRQKEKLLVVSSIHGGEVGGREGAVRVIEDMLDPRFLGNEAWVQAGARAVRHPLRVPQPRRLGGGRHRRDPGRGRHGHARQRQRARPQPPVPGARAGSRRRNDTLAEPEGNAVIDALFKTGKPDGWYLGTDNHGQGPDTYGAAGLQIVGQFDFQKSETLARFADGITESMKAYDVLRDLEDLRAATGQDLGAYHWGTLYDMLGYSASGLADRLLQHRRRQRRHRLRDRADGRHRGQLAHLSRRRSTRSGSTRSARSTSRCSARPWTASSSRSASVAARRTSSIPRSSATTTPTAPATRARRARRSRSARTASTRMQFFTDLNGYADRPLTQVRVARAAQRQGRPAHVRLPRARQRRAARAGRRRPGGSRG